MQKKYADELNENVYINDCETEDIVDVIFSNDNEK